MTKLDITDISIRDFLEKQGFTFRNAGRGRYVCSSPFSRDSNWSFCVYPTNTYFDWSTGHGGNIINLYSKLFNVSKRQAALDLNKSNYKQKEIYKPDISKPKNDDKFEYKKYVNTHEKEILDIQQYAKSRGITEGYLPGVFFTMENNKWVRNPAIMFLHRDEENKNICGAKFRKINNTEPRFSARGSLGIYLLNFLNSSSPFDPCLFILESETSSNTMWMWLRSQNRSGIILSSGGVSSPPKKIPEEFKHLPRKVIIDYDGNEKLYQERLKLYSHLDAEPIKMILPKGEDINSLYCQNRMHIIENLIFK